MKKVWQRRPPAYLFPLIILFIAIVLFIPYKQAIIFQYQNTDQVLAYIPLSKEHKFKMKYTHSIHLTDVVESYEVTKKQEIRQYELEYMDFAIGMPADASEGERFEQKDGKFYIKDMNRIFPFFDLRTGKVRANHRVIFQGKEYPLSESITPGTWVRIMVKKINTWQQLKGVNILEHT
ncbi:DUF1850 domain-containing protein [Bacillus sp. B-jedd]|uniref:DUF1850 domain-containing protein n=1 Tax=Bacillus sp. B-jedd TaxID=1476857 RepID=UPI0005157027|nr:DUF1850 domain-containing protein [Bacillus sp. B-jedd]CEG28566.1 RocC [Bacillus sp. B-jedd]